MLSELEGAVLGVLLRQQPLSAYAIRREFERSPTGNWSASAGAIYPLVKRLIQRGFITDAAVDGDSRNTRHLSITAAGQVVLREWVLASDPRIFGPAADPLRTRGFALIAMPAEEQRRCLEDWRAQTQTALKDLLEYLKRYETTPNTGIAIVYYGTVTELKGRLAWINLWLEQLQDNAQD